MARRSRLAGVRRAYVARPRGAAVCHCYSLLQSRKEFYERKKKNKNLQIRDNVSRSRAGATGGLLLFDVFVLVVQSLNLCLFRYRSRYTIGYNKFHYLFTFLLCFFKSKMCVITCISVFVVFVFEKDPFC